MLKFSRRLLMLLFITIVCAIMGCSSGSSSSGGNTEQPSGKLPDEGKTDEEPTETQDSIYEPGAAVSALSNENSQPITLYLWKKTDTGQENQGDGEDTPQGSYVQLSNGDYVEPGVQKLGISVTQRFINGFAQEQRVFVSDGGLEYQVEAIFDTVSGYYLCDFEFLNSDTFLTHPVLIQAIYSDDKTASKEKYVLTTTKGLRPDDGMLVEKGFGLSLGASILDDLKEQLGPLVAGSFPSAKIVSLKPADNSTGKSNGIFSIDISVNTKDIVDSGSGGTGNKLFDFFISILRPFLDFFATLVKTIIIQGDIFLNDTDSTGKRESIMGIEDLSWRLIIGSPFPLSDPKDSYRKALFFPLSDLLSGFDSAGGGLMDNMQLNSILFFNLYGLPETTDSNFAVIGGGLYTVDSNLVELDDENNPLWPQVEIDTTDTQMDLEKIKKPDETGIGIALSQYNLNQILSNMMNTFQIVIDSLPMELTNLILPDLPQNTIVTIKVNPDGIAIDMQNPENETGEFPGRVAMSDIRIEFSEAGKTDPIAELSMDLNMLIDVDLFKADNAISLVLQLKPLLDTLNLHVMKDNDLNLTILDHNQTLMKIVLQTFLTDGGETMDIIMPLSALGLIPKEGEEAGEITFDANGNCFMNLLVESLSMDNLNGCFISAAGF